MFFYKDSALENAVNSNVPKSKFDARCTKGIICQMFILFNLVLALLPINRLFSI